MYFNVVYFCLRNFVFAHKILRSSKELHLWNFCVPLLRFPEFLRETLHLLTKNAKNSQAYTKFLVEHKWTLLSLVLLFLNNFSFLLLSFWMPNRLYKHVNVRNHLGMCSNVCLWNWCFFSTGKKCLQVLKVTTYFHNTLNSFISTDQGRFDSSWYEPFRKQNLPASYSLLLSCSMTGRIRALLTICQCWPQMSQAVSAFDWQLLCCGVCVTAVCLDTHLWSEN